MENNELNIPSTVKDPHYRYKMPRIQTALQGSGNGIKTKWINLPDVSNALKLPVEYPLKFIGRELGSNTELKANSYLINGNHPVEKLQELLDKFIKKYVLCPKCHLPEIHGKIKVTKKDIKCTCRSCGTVSKLDNAHDFATYIRRNPPPYEEEDNAEGEKVMQEKEKEKKSEKEKKGKKEKKLDKELKKKDKNEEKKEVHLMSKVDIRVGKIVNIFPNEQGDKLYNEEIDIGNGEIRKIASGLREFVKIEDLKDSLVVVICNLRPKNLKGWKSHGMILCAETKDQKHVEPLRPPQGSQPGDLVYIGDLPREPVSDKNCPWDKVCADLMTNDKKVATYKGTLVWKTDKGEITATTISDGVIR